MTKNENNESYADKAWQLARSMRTCILVTWDGRRTRARPMSGTVDQASHAVYFLTDVSAEKIAQITAHPRVTLIFSNEGGDEYATLEGDATVSNDRAKIRELWTPFAKAWWQSADDPAIRLLQVDPSEAEIWEGPNKLVATAIMLTSAITGTHPNLSDHAHVDL